MTWLYSVVDQDELGEAIDDGLVSHRPSGDGQTIFNYTDKAQRTSGAWDIDAVRKCRGLIVDDDTEQIVARPWEKFFNYGDPQAKLGERAMDLRVEVTDKLDGSLGILHRAPDGSPRVATRGSFHSEQAEWATNWLRNRYPQIGWDYRLTPLVEIIYPENRIVCDYKGFAGLRLLGFVSIEWGNYFGPLWHWITGVDNHLNPTQVFPYATLREALEAPPRKGAEGLCVRFPGNTIVKIKQSDYVELHRIVTGLNGRSVWQRMYDGGTLDELLDEIPDELHDWTRTVWNHLLGQYDDLYSQIDSAYWWIHRGDDHTQLRRDEFAKAVKADFPDLAPFLFMRYDKSFTKLDAAIMKHIRPQGNSATPTTTRKAAA